jgi:glycosyltransferase involved in cell wall biosynthesis
VSEPKARALLDKTKNHLSNNGIINISTKQYSQSAYLNLLSSSDLFVMPSRLEGSSPAALEALWLGIPSILSQACGIDQFKDGDHGIILSKVTPQLLCDALYSVVQCPLKLRAWRSCIENDISCYTWNAYLDRYKFILSQ